MSLEKLKIKANWEQGNPGCKLWKSHYSLFIAVSLVGIAASTDASVRMVTANIPILFRLKGNHRVREFL
ncbi:MAG: hypothetical protein QNJ47_27295 [Nostocaceae cyanobacterium]|nr:hypothetical protein [Nostocaceae cyanobacterium]